MTQGRPLGAPDPTTTRASGRARGGGRRLAPDAERPRPGRAGRRRDGSAEPGRRHGRRPPSGPRGRHRGRAAGRRGSARRRPRDTALGVPGVRRQHRTGCRPGPARTRGAAAGLSGARDQLARGRDRRATGRRGGARADVRAPRRHVARWLGCVAAALRVPAPVARRPDPPRRPVTGVGRRGGSRADGGCRGGTARPRAGPARRDRRGRDASRRRGARRGGNRVPVQLQPKDALGAHRGELRIRRHRASSPSGPSGTSSRTRTSSPRARCSHSAPTPASSPTSSSEPAPCPGRSSRRRGSGRPSGRERPQVAGVTQRAGPACRCATVPQVHGVAADQLAHVARLLLVELNSRPENPLVQVDQRRVVSNGNFSLLGLGIGFEALRLALAHIGMLAERRIALLARTLRGHAPVEEHVRAGRWRSGYLVPVLLTNTAAAIASELKQMASPLTVMGTTVGDGVEDHNSLAFGTIQLTVTAAGWVQTLPRDRAAPRRRPGAHAAQPPRSAGRRPSGGAARRRRRGRGCGGADHGRGGRAGCAGCSSRRACRGRASATLPSATTRTRRCRASRHRRCGAAPPLSPSPARRNRTSAAGGRTCPPAKRCPDALLHQGRLPRDRSRTARFSTGSRSGWSPRGARGAGSGRAKSAPSRSTGSDADRRRTTRSRKSRTSSRTMSRTSSMTSIRPSSRTGTLTSSRTGIRVRSRTTSLTRPPSGSCGRGGRSASHSAAVVAGWGGTSASWRRRQGSTRRPSRGWRLERTAASAWSCGLCGRAGSSSSQHPRRERPRNGGSCPIRRTRGATAAAAACRHICPPTRRTTPHVHPVEADGPR